ncbi:PepSY domain-containing protein [Fimbriimonas ginsengisoli]|uniref:PepSY domain-containing protein n=1 Tax=Fimbriimonas ginsengisoli Gsoil 348 TaxID=661478 RepID=A0A068NTY1_FIMGI|nr:PepSY domain-containing protein [Fimbriimonas ginsengisoli]AIE86225.1 hypothetical protein OP10G_2857 [Fimbriimonas ginsengisoli Gsoil 348]
MNGKITVLISAALALGLSAMAAAQGAPRKHKHPHLITASAAAKIALAKYPGKLTREPHLEKEDGKMQYEVFIKTGNKVMEVNVLADSGKIGSVENTSAAEEAKEKGKGQKGKAKGAKPKKETHGKGGK